MAVGVALLLGAGLIWASGASVLEAYGGLFGHVWVVAGPERDGCGGYAVYPDWPGSRAGIQRWCVQYRG